MAIRWKSVKSSSNVNLLIMKDRFLFLLAVLILSSSNLHGQWVVKHVGVELAWIYDLEMHPQGFGIAVGDASLILRTEDHGESWFPISNNILHEINQVAFVSVDTVVITSRKVQKNGAIHRSTDGGYTWEQVYTYPDYFLSLQFFNDSVGLASGIDIILLSTDAGATWAPVYDIPSMTGFKEGIIRVDIAEDSIAYAAVLAWQTEPSYKSCRFLLKSADTGKTWKKVADLEEKYNESQIYFFDEWLAFTEHENSFQRTHDGGMTWEKTDNIQFVVGMSMPSKSIVYSINEQIPVGEYPGGFAICHSLDSGMTWQGTFQPGAAMKAIQFLNDSVGFVAGRHALIMKTEHGGGPILGEYPWHLYTGVLNEPDISIRFNLLPNPARGQVRLELDDNLQHNETLQVRLVHMSGKEMYAGHIPPFAYLHTISLEDMGSGVYMVEIWDEAGKRLGMQKLMVE